MLVRHIKKPTLAGLAKGLQFSGGMFRQHANYWLIKYTDKDDIMWSIDASSNPELYLFLALNRDQMIKDLYNELKK